MKKNSEQYDKKDIIKLLQNIKKDANRLHSGNVEHQRTHILATIQWLINKLN